MVRNNREEWKTYGNVFDNYTNRLLFKMAGQGFFEELESPIALGKEANVFSARKKDADEVVAVKIYRLENCNFNQMLGYIQQDPRYIGMPRSKRKVIFSWVQREYRNLLKAREVIRVPTPYTFKDHVLVMEYIGDDDGAAPMLKNQKPSDPQKFFDEIIANIRSLWHGAGLVHADLSEFNILNHQEKPIFIDFSQATTTDSKEAIIYLRRDLTVITTFFNKLGLKTDLDSLVEEITKNK